MGIIFTTRDYLIQSSDFPGFEIIQFGNLDHQDLDRWMSDVLTRIKGEPKNIFLPLVFGPVYSDLLGLRLALHIRSTVSLFQTANIFVYGSESFSSMRFNEFSGVFSTKGVILIDYSLEALKHYARTEKVFIKPADIPIELNKIHLSIPSNFYDSHSIANIWGMYRLLELEGIDPREIKALHNGKDQRQSIYFKWLLAKNKVNRLVNEEIQEVKREYIVKLAGVKIVDIIDLSKIKY